MGVPFKEKSGKAETDAGQATTFKGPFQIKKKNRFD